MNLIVKQTLRTIAVITISLLSTGCSKPLSMADIVEECRTPGEHLWVNPIDGTVNGNSVRFDFLDPIALAAENSKNLDPSPICVLDSLDAPTADVVSEINATAGTQTINGSSWGTGSASWEYDQDGRLTLWLSTDQ